MPHPVASERVSLGHDEHLTALTKLSQGGAGGVGVGAFAAAARPNQFWLPRPLPPSPSLLRTTSESPSSTEISLALRLKKRYGKTAHAWTTHSAEEGELLIPSVIE